MYTNILQDIKPLDKLYEESKIKLDLLKIEDDVLDSLLFKSYSNMTVDVVPQCMCGEAHGTELLGEMCLHCNTPVVEFNTSRNPIVWITAIGTSKFIAPAFWHMFNNLVKPKKINFDSLGWLTNTRYKASIDVPPVLISMVEELKLVRRYDDIIANIDRILAWLYNQAPMYNRKDKLMSLRKLWTRYSAVLQPKHLPIPDRNIFPMEDTQYGSKKTSIVTGMVKSLALNYRDDVMNGRDANASMSRIMVEVTLIYLQNMKELLAGKTRLIRNSIYGSKAPGSFRTVMLPISGPHHYEEVHVPWVIAVVNFRPYLVNQLQSKYGYNLMETLIILEKAVYVYNGQVDEILQSLLTQAKEKNGMGISMTMNRNPSQHKSSLLALYASKIKTDPDDFTTEYSMLLCGSFNSDLTILYIRIH